MPKTKRQSADQKRKLPRNRRRETRYEICAAKKKLAKTDSGSSEDAERSFFITTTTNAHEETKSERLRNFEEENKVDAASEKNKDHSATDQYFEMQPLQILQLLAPTLR